MEITTNTERFVNEKDVARGLAHVAPLKACFTAKDPAVNTRIMDAINRRFKVHQYVRDDEGGTPFSADWDLFFWCYADCKGRNMHYFYLMVNDRRTIEKREEDYNALREMVETEFQDLDFHVCFEYHSEDDEAAISAEAERVFSELGNKKWAEYRGMQGWLRKSELNGYYFMKKGASRNGWKIKPHSVCYIRKWEKKETKGVA